MARYSPALLYRGEASTWTQKLMHTRLRIYVYAIGLEDRHLAARLNALSAMEALVVSDEDGREREEAFDAAQVHKLHCYSLLWWFTSEQLHASMMQLHHPYRPVLEHHAARCVSSEGSSLSSRSACRVCCVASG